MKIDRVSYGGTFSLGDYNNEKIYFEASLDDGETEEEALAVLKKKVVAATNGNIDELFQRTHEIKAEIRSLQGECKKWAEHWQKVRSFLIAQGINPDAPEMPIMAELLPPGDDGVPF